MAATETLGIDATSELGPEGRSGSARRSIGGGVGASILIGLVAPVVLVAALYLLPFIRHPGQAPFGADTYKYTWRADVVSALGIGGLTPEHTAGRRPLGDRFAHPVMVSLVRSATGTSSLNLMRVLPAVVSVAIALAAACLAADGLGIDRRWAALVAVGVGASAYVAWTAVGYSTNLVLDALVVASAALAIRATFGGTRWDVAGAALLLACGSFYHWQFALVFALLLVGYGGFLFVGHVAARLGGGRHHVPRPGLMDALRVLAVPVLAGALAFAAFRLAPELPQHTPNPHGPHVQNFTAARLPTMALLLTVPLAMIGGILLALGREDRRRWAVALLVPWALLAGGGAVARHVIDASTPVYRWAGFALGIPLLIVSGALGIRWLRGTPNARRLALALGLVATIGLAAAGARAWWSNTPQQDAALFAQLATVRDYANGTAPNVRLLLVIDHGRPLPNVIFAGLEPSLYQRVGFLRIRVDREPLSTGSETALIFLRSLNRQSTPDYGTALGPGVLLLSGPPPLRPAGAAPGTPFVGIDGIVLIAAGAIVALTVAGVGWALMLSSLPVMGAVAIAPAFGSAVFGLVGTIASRLGIGLSGWSGVGVIAFTAVLGGVGAVAVRSRRRRSGEPPAPNPASPVPPPAPPPDVPVAPLDPQA